MSSLGVYKEGDGQVVIEADGNFSEASVAVSKSEALTLIADLIIAFDMSGKDLDIVAIKLITVAAQKVKLNLH